MHDVRPFPGQLLAFVELNPTTLRDILVLRLSDRKLQPFLRTRFNETVPRFSPDCQRFLMLKAVQQGQPAAAQINVVLNWFEELKQKVPTGKK